MTKTMIASKMTDGQIENIVSKLRDALRKHREEITLDGAQLALGTENIGMRMFAIFREQAEAVSNLIVRRVKVNRSHNPQEAIDATGRVQYVVQYVDREVVDNMPRGEGEEKEVVFFQPRLGAYDKNGVISDDALEKEYEFVGLNPIDPYSLSAVNEDDPSFADNCPNATHWQDANGKWCYTAFGRWRDGERGVSVSRRGRGWRGSWRFAGARK